MDHNRLGQTDLWVSPIGFGAFKIGRNEKIKYPSPYELPTENEAARILHGVLDLGINLIDTAPAYGLSEERIGRALWEKRGDYVLSSKVGEIFENGRSSYDYTPEATQKSLEKSLKKLRTDYLDILLIHSDGVIEHDLSLSSPLVEQMLLFKKKGQVRAIGMSPKSLEGAKKACSWSDILMVDYNMNHTENRDLIVAHHQKKGFLVKKALGSGQLDPDQAIPYVLNTQGVGSLVLGSLNLAHLRQALSFS